MWEWAWTAEQTHHINIILKLKKCDSQCYVQTKLQEDKNQKGLSKNNQAEVR